MPRSRSRSRERSRRDKSRDRRDRERDRDRRSRDRRRSRSRDKDKDSRSKHHKRDRRSRDKSYDRRDKRRDSRERSSKRDKRRKSSSSEERSYKSSRNRTKSPSSSSTSVKPIIITASQITGRSKANRAAAAAAASEKTVDHRESFEIANEFSQEGFEQFSRDHGIDFTNLETEEDRQALHEKMEQVLKEHFAAQGKIYPPPKPEKPAINAATGFVNDGSFLEQFKKMQDEYKQQMEDERKRKIAEERLKSLPLRRRGGKILKTGIVAKTTTKDKQGGPSADAWSLYFKEVQKYKSASCDSDAPTRPLVK